MMKEKTIVCVGIVLILAILTMCAFYYGSSESPAVKNDMEISGRVVSFGLINAAGLSAETDFPPVEFPPVGFPPAGSASAAAL